jgi:hypothetical protein
MSETLAADARRLPIAIITHSTPSAGKRLDVRRKDKSRAWSVEANKVNEPQREARQRYDRTWTRSLWFRKSYRARTSNEISVVKLYLYAKTMRNPKAQFNHVVNDRDYGENAQAN